MKKTLLIAAVLVIGWIAVYQIALAPKPQSTSERYLSAFHACSQEMPNASLDQVRACAEKRSR